MRRGGWFCCRQVGKGISLVQLAGMDVAQDRSRQLLNPPGKLSDNRFAVPPMVCLQLAGIKLTVASLIVMPVDLSQQVNHMLHFLGEGGEQFKEVSSAAVQAIAEDHLLRYPLIQSLQLFVHLS